MTTSTLHPIALVTGGSRGLGRNTALALAARGSDLLLTYRDNEAAARDTVAGVEALGRRAVALRLDVADSASFRGFAAQVKHTLAEVWHRDTFDHLVNNAGIGVHAAITETTEDQFDQLVKVHLKGPYFLTQALLPLMADGGRIVNLSTGLARFTLPGFSAYAAMKGGIEVFTRYLAKELGARGIRANTIAPGAIATDFGGGMVRDNAQLNALIASETPLGRVGLPDDVGGAVAALLSADSGWVNGQRIEVSGGIHL